MLYKHIQDIKKTQIELLEMKTIICEMEKVLNGNNDRFYNRNNMYLLTSSNSRYNKSIILIANNT